MYSKPAIACKIALMNRLVVTALLLVAFSGLVVPVPVSSAQLVDRIVAVVNEDVITELELEFEVDRVAQSLARTEAGTPSRDLLRKRILELLIGNRLQIQRAEQLGIRISEAQLDGIINVFRKQNGLEDKEAFAAFLERSGDSLRQFRRSVHEDALIREAVRRDVIPFIRITDEEIDRQIMKRTEGKFISDYNLRHIFVEVKAGATAEEKQGLLQLVEDVRRRVVEGESFPVLAAEYSDTGTGVSGGDLGWRDASSLPDEFLAGLGNLSPGEVSDVIKAANGFHLLQLLDRRDVSNAVDRFMVRLKIITLDREAEDAGTQAREAYSRLLSGEPFNELAKELSIDLATASKGGDIGWVNLDELLPEIREAVLELGVGETTVPFESRLGWHIVSLVDEAAEMVSKEKIRQQALDELRERYLFEGRRDWINLLRSNAHIEIKVTG